VELSLQVSPLDAWLESLSELLWHSLLVHGDQRDAKGDPLVEQFIFSRLLLLLLLLLLLQLLLRLRLLMLRLIFGWLGLRLFLRSNLSRSSIGVSSIVLVLLGSGLLSTDLLLLVLTEGDRVSRLLLLLISLLLVHDLVAVLGLLCILGEAVGDIVALLWVLVRLHDLVIVAVAAFQILEL